MCTCRWLQGICNQEQPAARAARAARSSWSRCRHVHHRRCPWQPHTHTHRQTDRQTGRQAHAILTVYQSFKTQHSVPINKCVSSWAEAKPQQELLLLQGKKDALSIYATGRWTLLLLTISFALFFTPAAAACPFRALARICTGLALGSGHTRIERSSARICHVLYIYSNQWTVECTRGVAGRSSECSLRMHKTVKI